MIEMAGAASGFQKQWVHIYLVLATAACSVDSIGYNAVSVLVSYSPLIGQSGPGGKKIFRSFRISEIPVLLKQYTEKRSIMVHCS